MDKVPPKQLARDEEYFNTDHLRTDLKKRAVRGAGATVFSQGLTFLVQMGGTVILARLLTPEDFGLVTMVTTFSLLLQNFGFNGFTEAVIQKEDLKHGTASTLFWLNAVICIALTLLFMALGPVIAWFYHEPKLKLITAVISLSIISSGISTIHLALLKRMMKFSTTSSLGVVSKLVSVVIAILLAWLGLGYWALVVSTVALPLVGSIGALWFCRWRPSLPGGYSDVKPMVGFAANVYGNFTLNYASRNFDNLLVGWRYGPQSLGFYKKAYDLFALPVSQLTSPLANVAVAALSRLVNEPEKYRRYYLDAVSVLAFVGMAVSLVLTLTARDLILLILGPQWGKAGDIFAFFGPGIGVMLIYYTNGWLHISLGRPERWFRWGFVELAVTGGFFIVGLPFGPSGVAAAWTVSFFVLTVAGLWYAGQPIQLTVGSIISASWKYFVSALAAGLVCRYFLYSAGFMAAAYAGAPVLARIAVSFAACAFFYLAFIVITHRSLEPLTKVLSLGREMMPSVNRA